MGHPDNKAVLGVMVKAPVAGLVKTRLVPPLTEHEAAGLYRAFLADIFARLQKLDGVDVVILYTPASARENMAKTFPQVSGLTSQEGKCLGERLSNAFASLFASGYERVAIIGSDSPDLPLPYIREAFTTLLNAHRKGSIVIGPARDGGYYLIAADSPPSYVLFDGITWSTDRVLAETIKRAEEAAIPYWLLPEWYDMDAPEDLPLLLSNSGGNPDAPESTAYLKQKLSWLIPAS